LSGTWSPTADALVRVAGADTELPHLAPRTEEGADLLTDGAEGGAEPSAPCAPFLPGSPVSSSVTTTGGPKAARAGAARARVSAYAHRRVVMRWTMKSGRARGLTSGITSTAEKCERKAARPLPRSPQRGAPHITPPKEVTVRRRHHDAAPAMPIAGWAPGGAISLPIPRFA